MPDGPAYSLQLSAQEIVRYRIMAQMARETESDAWARAGLVAGATVADIGCGPGLVLIEIAGVVGPSGSVTGIDREASAVEAAGHLIAEASLTNASVRRGDAWATGLDAASVDVVNIRHVLAHNTDENQRRIAAHALELLVPGGTIYVVDSDMTGFRQDPDDTPAIVEMNDRYAEHLRATGREPVMGPKLGSLLASVGFADVERIATVTIVSPERLAAIRPPGWAAAPAMIETGHATADDVERWDRALTDFAATVVQRGAVLFVPTYSVIAGKPTA